MARAVNLNTQRTIDLQNQAAVLHAQFTSQLSPAAAQNHDQSHQIQYQLHKGIIQPDDVRAFRGV